MPAQQSRWRNDWIKISQRLSSDFLCERSERAAFRTSKQYALSPKSLPQSAVLGF
jgi:hypothetical protein